MDVRLHHRAVDPDLVGIVDLGAERVLDESHVDPLERGRLHFLDVSLERLLIGYWTSNIEAAERSIADGVGEVEGELVVAEPAELLHQEHTQHLLSTHSLSTASSTDLAALATDEIVVHPFRCFGMLVEDSAHRLQLARMHVGVERRDEHELVRQYATHRRRQPAPGRGLFPE